MGQGRTADATVNPLDETIEDISTPVMPDFLTVEAKKEWLRVIDEMKKVGTLRSRDLVTISTYCQTWSQFIEVQKELTKSSSLFTHGTVGQLKSNPLIKTSLELVSTLKQLASELLLTPNSRGAKIDPLSGAKLEGKKFGKFLEKEKEEFKESDFDGTPKPKHAVEKPLRQD
jgi:P27 family predicted phage terminase small subunit